MTRIFLSYSRSDALAASYISRELMARSADVFVDYQSLRGGENFPKRIGEEISAADAIVLLLSPHSVVSQWVHAEVTWALCQKKTIVPVLLSSTASYNTFWFVLQYELVDFENWVAGEVRPEAIKKLAVALELPTTPTRSFGEVPEQVITSQLAEDQVSGAVPYRTEDLEQLFAQAVKYVDQNPERSNYLSEQILRADPDYAEGQAQELLERGDALLKPGRLAKLHGQAATAMEKGDWARAERIGNDMLVIDESDAAARKIIDTARLKAAEETYQRAQSVNESGDWEQASQLLDEVWRLWPKFGDPQQLTRRRPITASLSPYLTRRGRIWSVSGTVTALAAAPGDAALAMALAQPKPASFVRKAHKALAQLFTSLRGVDISPKAPARTSGGIIVWLINKETRDGWHLKDHKPPVLTMDYSKDLTFASLASDGTLAIRVGDRLGRIQRVALVVSGVPRTLTFAKLVFGREGLVAVGGFDDRVALWRPTITADAAWIAVCSADVVAIALSPDGSSVGVGCSDGSLTIYSGEDGTIRVGKKTPHLSPMCSMVFSPDSQLLATWAGARPPSSKH